MDVSSINKSLSGNSGLANQNAADTQDRFLKLLVAQMQNQDPMNPLDNAQVTSQMAQIQTVTGITGLSNSIKDLGSQFTQMQALQSVALVGRDVTLAASNVVIKQVDGKPVGQGAFDLSGAADTVKIEVLSPAGAVIDTIDMGAQSAGLHKFSWPAEKGAGYENGLSFRVSATRGAAQVSTTTYATDKVVAVNTNGARLQVKLEGLGIVDYSVIKLVD